jgi:hypothetical protein
MNNRSAMSGRRPLQSKKLSRAERARIRNDFFARKKALRRTKQALVKAARAMESDLPYPDVGSEVYFTLKSANEKFIQERGGFPSSVAYLATADPDWETKEVVADWLRHELKALRDAEAQPGSAPVRRGSTLSRLQISKIAIDLFECLAGNSLFSLFQELLEVDRHRKSLANGFEELSLAAQIQAQAQLRGLNVGVRQLAKLVSVAPSTVTRWMKSQPFCEQVELYKRVWDRVLRENYFEQIRAALPHATDTECFCRAFELDWESKFGGSPVNDDDPRVVQRPQARPRISGTAKRRPKGSTTAPRPRT